MPLPRRRFISRTAAAVTAAAFSLPARAAAEPFVPGSSPYASSNPFFASPVFDPKAGISAPVDAIATAEFQRFVESHPDQSSIPFPKVNGVRSRSGEINKWGTAYAAGQKADPIWRITGNVPAEVDLLRTRGFHAPAWLGQMLSGTSDSPFVVQDFGHGLSLWAAKAAPGEDFTIHVAAAGYFEHASNGLDRRNPLSDNQINFRSRGAIPDAMVIRADLVRRGIAAGSGLGHVLHMFFVETDFTAGFCHPMVACEKRDKKGWGAEGLRIAIRPEIDLAQRSLSPAALVIALTLQTHGAYFGDNSGSGSALKAEQISATRDPWALAGIEINQDCLEGGITWPDFYVLPKGWQAGVT